MRVLVALAILSCAATFAGCSNRISSLPVAAGSQSVHQSLLQAPLTVPDAFRCLPSGLPTGSGVSPSLAYMANCAVSASKEASTLHKLAVAMMAQTSTGSFIEYCTGTPLHYDAATNVGFVVTAAHCVTGGPKKANAQVQPSNIATFSTPLHWIYQGIPGRVSTSSQLTGQITAVYLPSQYCYGPHFSGGHCSDLQRQDGDVAVIKIAGINGHTLAVDHHLRLAPANSVLPHATEIMALGYGFNTSATPHDRVLYYITYEYFENDAYGGVTSELSLMNGYHKNNTFYSVICQGDSGGGDFYWDGTHWNLVGAHSWGPVPCGVWGHDYGSAYDISADTRAFNSWIERIVRDDVEPSGCAALGESYVCSAR